MISAKDAILRQRVKDIIRYDLESFPIRQREIMEKLLKIIIDMVSENES